MGSAAMMWLRATWVFIFFLLLGCVETPLEAVTGNTGDGLLRVRLVFPQTHIAKGIVRPSEQAWVVFTFSSEDHWIEDFLLGVQPFEHRTPPYRIELPSAPEGLYRIELENFQPNDVVHLIVQIYSSRTMKHVLYEGRERITVAE
jgi:hypothetical protein